MMLLGMINWTFTWLDPKGPLSYGQFADAVLAVCRGGMTTLPPAARAPAAKAERAAAVRRSGKRGNG
jgi:hypothetical protein